MNILFKFDKVFKGKRYTENSDFHDLLFFERFFGSSDILQNRLLNAISAQIQNDSSELVIYKGAS